MGVSEHFDINGKAGEAIVLPITQGPATGYEWTLELPPGVERLEDGPPREVETSTALGAATGAPLQVLAAAGDYLVIARLARPWQKDQPVRIVSIQLHVT
jgi:predicted secreted protein